MARDRRPSGRLCSLGRSAGGRCLSAGTAVALRTATAELWGSRHHDAQHRCAVVGQHHQVGRSAAGCTSLSSAESMRASVYSGSSIPRASRNNSAAKPGRLRNSSRSASCRWDGIGVEPITPRSPRPPWPIPLLRDHRRAIRVPGGAGAVKFPTLPDPGSSYRELGIMPPVLAITSEQVSGEPVGFCHFLDELGAL